MFSPPNGIVIARFHIVLATWRRRGIFGAEEGRLIYEEWRRNQSAWRTAIIRVSFVPDHVHIAVRVHPVVSPAQIVAALMNAAQEVVKTTLIREGVEQLWNASAYFASYGDLTSSQMRKYIEGLKLDE